tara:strand:- start:482 stop:2065 length:1584 start_codon:yes stop_codon:yes gene_type:complete
MEISMASCTDTRNQTYINKQNLAIEPISVDGQYTLAAVDKFAEDLAKNILQEADKNPIKIAVNRYGPDFYTAVDYINTTWRNRIGSNAGEALAARWDRGNITNLEIADFMESYNYTADGLINQNNLSKLNLELNNYYNGGITESILGGFCNSLKNIFNQIDAFYDLIGVVDGLIQDAIALYNKIPRDYDGFKTLIQEQIIDKLIEEIQTKIIDVIVKVYQDIMAAIENFDPVGIISDAVTNINRMHTKRVMTLKERMCNEMTEKEQQKLKDKLKGFMDYALGLFENVDLETVQFLVYRFCALATNVEALIREVKNPLDSFGNRYQRVVQRLQTIGNMNTSTAIRNGGVRFSEEERRATINSLRDVWEGDSGQVLRTPTGEDAIVIKEITAQEYKDLPPCLAVLKGTDSRFGLDPAAKSFKEDDYGIGLPAYTHLDLDVKVYLARMQSKLGEKIVITKGWVNKEYNDKIKGSPESSHLSGLVIDIQNNFNLNSDEKVEEFKTRAIAAGFRYIVIYDKHIHLDIRDIPR